MQSVSYRDRSLSRERTPLAYTQELRTGVNGISDYPPNILRVEVVFISEKFLWLDMSLGSLDSSVSAYCSLWRVQYVQKSLPQDNQLKLPFRTLLKTTRTPKYSCRDCWTGVHQMNNDQQEPDTRTLWGLKRKPLTNKPKEERIMETVNRMIHRIQNDERKCLWPNTLTRLA